MSEHIVVSRGTFDEFARALKLAAPGATYQPKMITIGPGGFILEVAKEPAHSVYDLAFELRKAAAEQPLLLSSPPQKNRVALLMTEAAEMADHFRGYQGAESTTNLVPALKVLRDLEDVTAAEADACDYGDSAKLHEARAKILKKAISDIETLSTAAAEATGTPV